MSPKEILQTPLSVRELCKSSSQAFPRQMQFFHIWMANYLPWIIVQVPVPYGKTARLPAVPSQREKSQPVSRDPCQLTLTQLSSLIDGRVPIPAVCIHPELTCLLHYSSPHCTARASIREGVLEALTNAMVQRGPSISDPSLSSRNTWCFLLLSLLFLWAVLVADVFVNM